MVQARRRRWKTLKNASISTHVSQTPTKSTYIRVSVRQAYSCPSSGPTLSLSLLATNPMSRGTRLIVSFRIIAN
ncbi:hypothetical protein M378DRAFT_166695 [Amanita muscaria Koide BX008]|uniref:Uncharacterized protein n=1 Tax=Amanita muscaria (strain Koide BX008) TaxID=946122 RepID=A0A0C2SEW3_AMAMK|nr:hypothetical protein M378DRAFT_166695 [Amanita muscaria Koide BX008]